MVSLPGTLDDLVKDYYQPTVTAAFGTFTYGYSDLPSPFSRWLEDELGTAISKSGKLKLFNRSAAAAMDPSFKSVYGDFFTKTGVDALLAGHFDLGGMPKVHLELTGLSNGTLIGTTEIIVPVSSLPAGLQIRPSPKVQELASSLSGVLPATDKSANTQAQKLTVSASTDRGTGAVYKEGENLVVLATVNMPAYVRIYHIGVDKKIQRIYPNRFGGGDGFIASGAIVRIPGTSDPFTFRMGPPFGTEFIKVVASTKPFSPDDKDFTDLEGDAKGVLISGLRTGDGADALYAEALATYVIVPAR